MSNDNPYQSPGEPDLVQKADADDRPGLAVWSYVAWTTVLLINLPLPLWFGWSVTLEHGRIGMALAIGVCWLAGLVVCFWRRVWIKPLVAGGLLFSLTQVMPIPQMLAGIVALSMLDGWFPDGPGDDFGLGSELHGFLATLLTGGGLLVVAAGIGLVIEVITPARWWKWLD